MKSWGRTVYYCIIMWGISVFENAAVIPLSRNPCKYSLTPYISRNYSLAYILPTTIWVYLHSVFFWWAARNTIFSARVRFGRSRSSKIIDFSTNRKRVCDFLLVFHSNLGPISYHFGDIAGFCAHDPTHIPPKFWGCSRWTRSPMLGFSRAFTLG